MARTTIRTEDITASEVTTAKMATDPTNASNLSSGSVPTAQLGNVDTSGLEDDIALLGFKVASNGSLAKYNLVDQTIDAYEDASGVNTGSSTNEARSSSNYYFGGTANAVISGNYDSTAVDGDYTYYRWTTVTSSGSFTTDTAQNYEYLVVAGGGGGGGGNGGGAGAGGYRANNAYDFAVAATTISGITVGDGGAGSSYGRGTKGSNSVFSTISGTGGGGGGGVGSAVGGTGGSAGGGGEGSAGGSGNEGGYSPVEGYNGSSGGGSMLTGGGGGGGQVGQATSSWVSGAGGYGVANDIDGTDYWYSGGGGGGGSRAYQTLIGGDGGRGGGGGGCTSSGDAEDQGAGGADGRNPGNPGISGSVGGAGGTNTGGGGGGSPIATTDTGGKGGSGIVIIKRLTAATTEGLNMTLVSATTAAQAAPTKGDIVLTYTNGAGTTTLDTDLTAEISADGGSTWTSLPLASEGSTGSHNIATAHDVTISSTITAPYNMAYRIKTLNQGDGSKTTRIQAVSLGWS